MPAGDTAWPHAPLHRLAESGTFLVTAGTYGKLHHFAGPDRLGVLQRGLLQLAAEHGWHIEAWSVFSNHYHFIGHSPANQLSAESLRALLSTLDARTAGWINRLDQQPGRKVWHNFWETRLTFHRSYLARLNYVHHNPVKHGLVPVANQYPWCSARWFESTATPAQAKTIRRFSIDRVAVLDDFEVEGPW